MASISQIILFHFLAGKYEEVYMVIQFHACSGAGQSESPATPKYLLMRNGYTVWELESSPYKMKGLYPTSPIPSYYVKGCSLILLMENKIVFPQQSYQKDYKFTSDGLS
ncbi:MAG: hypothetical protein DRN37_06250 [Thermoplasmata archaeon]|nr:MAG: hypothetical protein DRN37_06250 [Thermoplasmata archaeon]